MCNLVKKPFAVILFYRNVLFSNLMPNILLGVSYTFLFVGNCDEWATSYNQQTSTIEYLYGINYSTPYHRLGQRRNYRFVLNPNYFKKYVYMAMEYSTGQFLFNTFSSTPWSFWICILYLRYVKMMAKNIASWYDLTLLEIMLDKKKEKITWFHITFFFELCVFGSRSGIFLWTLFCSKTIFILIF